MNKISKRKVGNFCWEFLPSPVWVICCTLTEFFTVGLSWFCKCPWNSQKIFICCFIFSNVIVTTRKGDLKMQKSFLNDWLTRNLQRNNRRLAKMCHLHSLGHTLDKMQKNETFQTKSREETRKRRCTISQMTWVSSRMKVRFLS